MKHWIACLALLAVLDAVLAAESKALQPDVAQPNVAQPDEEVIAAQQGRVEVVREISRSVLAIFTSTAGDNGGSGVVISPDGYALTNFHVAQPCGVAMKCGMNDGVLYDAVVVGIDPVGDVALIKLLGRDDFPHAELGDSDALRPGDEAYVVGNPFLLAADFAPTVTHGIISGVHRYQYPAGTLLEYADCIQTDASINPGNSGGPLFDGDGRLVGINGRGSFEKRGRVNVGVGYAISINQIKKFLGCLHSGRIVDHATAGFRAASDYNGRAYVAEVLPGSDADRRGVRQGDRLVSLGGRDAGTVNAFKNALGVFPQGWRPLLALRRGEQILETPLRLSGVHAEGELVEMVSTPIAPPAPGEEEPDDEEPREQPSEGEPNRPRRRPRESREATPAVPEAAQPFIEERAGYANYYFNRLHQERLQDAHDGRFGALRGADALAVTALSEKYGEVRFDLRDDAAAMFAVSGEAVIPISADLGLQSDPAGSGGLLAALALWSRWCRLGPQSFDDVHYYGTAPVVGVAALCDRLDLSQWGVVCRAYFDTSSGRLVLWEVERDPGVDPCEVYFEDYSEGDGATQPRGLRIVVGVDQFDAWSDLRLAPVAEVDALLPTDEAVSGAATAEGSGA